MAHPIRYEECPHCYANVMVRADGLCIACGKNRLDPSGADRSRTMVTVENIHRLPDCCFLCGAETRRRQKLVWTYRANTSALPWFFAPFVALFSFLPGSEYRVSQRMNLPVCPDCKGSARRVKPVSIRTGLDCRIVVHRTFRKHFEALNGRETLEWECDRGKREEVARSFAPFRMG